MDISYDDPLAAKMSDLRNAGQSARLSDLTDFSWDEVYILRGLTREKIEEVVGAPALRDEYFDPEVNLLVFEDKGQIVKVIGVNGLLTADHPRWPSDVRLHPWGRGLLRFIMPAASPGA